MDASGSPEDSSGYPQIGAAAKLARKRANDRRAQRAARERRQNYIDSLLHQIEALSGMPHEHVNELFESNRQLRAENELLKSRPSARLDTVSEHNGVTRSVASVASAATADGGDVGNSPVQVSLLQLRAHESRANLGNLQIFQDRHDSDAGLAIPPCPSAICPQLELFQCLPVNLPPVVPVDRILMDFMLEARRDGASLAPCDTCPDVHLLCQPRPPHQKRCLTVVILDVLNAYPDVVSVTEVVASFINMYRMLNWQCQPTLENYKKIPEWLRPTPVQLRVPHHSWIDRIPWPGVRSYLVCQQDDFVYEEFAAYFRAAVTVSWPYSTLDILTRQPSESGCGRIRINPVFEQHVANLDVWSLKDSFVEHFPVFKDVINR